METQLLFGILWRNLWIILPSNEWLKYNTKDCDKTGAQKEGARWEREEGGGGAGQPSSVTSHTIGPAHLSVSFIPSVPFYKIQRHVNVQLNLILQSCFCFETFVHVLVVKKRFWMKWIECAMSAKATNFEWHFFASSDVPMCDIINRSLILVLL